MPVNYDDFHPVTSLQCLQLSTVGRADACLSPRPGELSYCKIPNNRWAFICFNQLTDQAFFWDQAAIWDRRLIPFSQKSRMKMSQTSPASQWTHASFWAIIVHLLQMKLLRQRKWFSQPALVANSSSLLLLTVVFICFTIALIILRDTLLACPFANNPFPHVYLKLLVSLPPPNRRPDPVAVLPLSRTDAEAQFEFDSVILTDRKKAQHVKKVKTKNVQCQWSRLPWCFKRIN